MQCVAKLCVFVCVLVSCCLLFWASFLVDWENQQQHRFTAALIRTVQGEHRWPHTKGRKWKWKNPPKRRNGVRHMARNSEPCKCEEKREWLLNKLKTAQTKVWHCPTQDSVDNVPCQSKSKWHSFIAETVLLQLQLLSLSFTFSHWHLAAAAAVDIISHNILHPTELLATSMMGQPTFPPVGSKIKRERQLFLFW